MLQVVTVCLPLSRSVAAIAATAAVSAIAATAPVSATMAATFLAVVLHVHRRGLVLGRLQYSCVAGEWLPGLVSRRVLAALWGGLQHFPCVDRLLAFGLGGLDW